MHRFLKQFGRSVDGINSCAVFLSQISLFILMAVTTYAVIARYFFRSPSMYATEICVYLLLLSTWLSVGYVHLQGRHVRVEIFLSIFGPRGRRMANFVSSICILLFCTVLIWAGLMVAETAYLRNYKSTSVLRFPLWITYGLIPVGGFLLGLAALRKLLLGEEPPAADQDKEI